VGTTTTTITMRQPITAMSNCSQGGIGRENTPRLPPQDVHNTNGDDNEDNTRDDNRDPMKANTRTTTRAAGGGNNKWEQ
jgi:hypothetical protein